ncbi:N-acetylgalactosamine 6-sulfate sulfatase [Candidatus Poribacteria bacterium]|nr:N-acetylgalactosamine 6-sulfate sulfatase [Candidatus Poribacteria bacterium]
MANPNVLVILTDDQGWGDLSIHGNTNLDTPNVDSIAQDGVLFNRFYVCPVCAPTRAEFLTGRYHLRGQVHGVTEGAERLCLREKTIADTFKAAGYSTGAFGKWHNGTQHPYHPNARGFDEFFGFCSGHWGHYFDAEVEHNGRFTRGKGYLPDEITDRAIDFMATNAGLSQPFFCYLPFNIPHTPFQVPNRFYEKFRNSSIEMKATNPEHEDVERTRSALALCENIDWNVGRLLAKLDQLGVAEDTIIFYFGDNGPNGARWNGGMKGTKGSTDEGGVRVPGLMRWTKQIQPGTVIEEIAGGIDLLPTLADMADVEVLSEKPLDGCSLKPLLINKTMNWSDRMIFTHQRNAISVRNQQFRLDAKGKLYDMLTDPGQTRDVSDDFPEMQDVLTKAVDEWCAEVLPIQDDRPFSVGYWESTPLPARDGVPHGGIRRSAKAPNCSYFTNWTKTRESITWDVIVGTEDNYEAIVYYACPAEDIGAIVELSFNGKTVRGQVTEPHDPPLVGEVEDLFPRGSESLVKDFKQLTLGTIHMVSGRGTLTLRALDIPGSQVMDVRRVMLIKKEE